MLKIAEGVGEAAREGPTKKDACVSASLSMMSFLSELSQDLHVAGC